MKRPEVTVPRLWLDGLVALLVSVQMMYGCWEIYELGFDPVAVATYSTVILALPGYFRARKWAWAMMFLFSVFILHESFILYRNWFCNPGSWPRWLALLEFAASPLCLRALGAGAKGHGVDWWEAAKLLAAITMAVVAILIRGTYFPAFACIIFERQVSPWEYAVAYSRLSMWRTLLLLWCCYGGIISASWASRRLMHIASDRRK